MGKRYDPDNTDLLPAKAQKAFEKYAETVVLAEERLVRKWFALSDKDWANTVRKLKEWAAMGFNDVEVLRRVIEQIVYERGEK